MYMYILIYSLLINFLTDQNVAHWSYVCVHVYKY